MNERQIKHVVALIQEFNLEEFDDMISIKVENEQISVRLLSETIYETRLSMLLTVAIAAHVHMSISTMYSEDENCDNYDNYFLVVKFFDE